MLIVEDETFARTLLKDNLEFEGFEVECAANGSLALELAKKVQLDIAVIDVGLPDMTGWEVCKGLQRDVRTAETTLVILSGKMRSEVLEGMKKLGLKHFVPKPYDPIALGRMLKGLLPVKG